jgi:hypothetical protein
MIGDYVVIHIEILSNKKGDPDKRSPLIFLMAYFMPVRAQLMGAQHLAGSHLARMSPPRHPMEFRR